MKKLILAVALVFLCSSAHAAITLTWGTNWIAGWDYVTIPPPADNAQWVDSTGYPNLLPAGALVELMRIVDTADSVPGGDDDLIDAQSIGAGFVYTSVAQFGPGGGGIQYTGTYDIGEGDQLYIRAYDNPTGEHGDTMNNSRQEDVHYPDGIYPVVGDPRFAETFAFEGGIQTIPEPSMLLLGIPAVALLLRKKK